MVRVPKEKSRRLIELYSNKVVEILTIYCNIDFLQLRAEDKDVNAPLFTCSFNTEGQRTSFIE